MVVVLKPDSKFLQWIQCHHAGAGALYTRGGGDHLRITTHAPIITARSVRSGPSLPHFHEMTYLEAAGHPCSALLDRSDRVTLRFNRLLTDPTFHTNAHQIPDITTHTRPEVKQPQSEQGAGSTLVFGRGRLVVTFH